MKIINEPGRLCNCNAKIISSKHNEMWYKDSIGETVKISHCYQESIDCEPPESYEEDQIDICGYSIESEDIKIILDNDFLEVLKSENLAVNCRTQEEATEFCNWLLNNGVSWESGASLSEYTFWDDYGKEMCYNYDRKGMMKTGIDWFKKEGDTIIRFSDCVFPKKDFIDTKDFKEFVKYWKENNISIEFDTMKDKEQFWKVFLNNPRNCHSLSVFPCLVWSERLQTIANTDRNDPGYRIINYKDLKDWREILNNKRCGQKGCKQSAVKPIYRLTKEPITLKEILSKNPCREEFDEFCKELVEEGFDYISLINGDLTFTNENFFRYKTVQNNIDWAIEVGLAEEVEEEEFEPFDITIPIKSKEELVTLWCQVVVDGEIAKEENYIDGIGYDEDFEIELFEIVDNEMDRLEDD